MSQDLQNFAKFQKIQLDNLVDFEKCSKTRIFSCKDRRRYSRNRANFCLSQIYAGDLEADVLSFAVAVEPEHEVLGVLREVLQVLDDPVLLSGLRQNFTRFRLYRRRSLQVNTRVSAFFKIYQII